MRPASLAFVDRPADGAPDGLLVLHHGRGSDELDLIGLADVLDPQQRLHVVSPRAPLQLAGAPGNHWYVVPRVGHPDAQTFEAASTQLATFHDELWAWTGVTPERTVLGGFSMGSVMSFASGLGAGRPAVAGILGLSGFIPTVEGWSPDLARADVTRVAISHGVADPVIPIDFARAARALLDGAGFTVQYDEHLGAHWIEPASIPSLVAWLAATLPAAG
jgi:phospholipase/carboxylesterase